MLYVSLARSRPFCGLISGYCISVARCTRQSLVLARSCPASAHRELLRRAPSHPVHVRSKQWTRRGAGPSAIHATAVFRHTHNIGGAFQCPGWLPAGCFGFPPRFACFSFRLKLSSGLFVVLSSSMLTLRDDPWIVRDGTLCFARNEAASIVSSMP